mgnify:CR=1 FL=1
MIEERVEVVRVADGLAWVQPKGSSGCARCDAGEGCGAGLWQRAFGLRPRQIVLPDSQLQVGDQLLLSITEGALLSSAAMLYLLPLVTLIAGALIGSYLGAADGGEWQVLLGATLGLISGLLLARGWAATGRGQLTPGVARAIPVVPRQNAVDG